MRKLLLAIVAGLFVLPAALACAQASCDCEPRSSAEIFASGDLVVDALVIEIQDRPAGRIAFVSVEKIYSGSAASVIRVETPADACGLELRPGERWVIVATRTGSRYLTSQCAGTSQTTELIDDRFPVGSPSIEPNVRPPVNEPKSRLPVFAAGGLLLLTLTAHLWLRRQSRSRR